MGLCNSIWCYLQDTANNSANWTKRVNLHFIELTNKFDQIGGIRSEPLQTSLKLRGWSHTAIADTDLNSKYSKIGNQKTHELCRTIRSHHKFWFTIAILCRTSARKKPLIWWQQLIRNRLADARKSKFKRWLIAWITSPCMVHSMNFIRTLPKFMNHVKRFSGAIRAVDTGHLLIQSFKLKIELKEYFDLPKRST